MNETNNSKNLSIPLGPQESFCDLIDKGMLQKEASKTEKFYPLRPSAAGQCARRLAYDLMQYHGYATYEKEPMTPATLRLLNLGHSVEYSALKNMEVLEDYTLKYKQQLATMFRLDPTATEPQGKLIEGSMDVVLWSDKHKGLLDVKSAKDGFSSFRSTRWDETLEKYGNMQSLVPFGEQDLKTGLYHAFYADNLEAFIEELNGDFLIDNLDQLNLYACSPFLVERGIKFAVIYKYNKNTSQHYEIRFRPSPARYQHTFEKFNRINQAVANKDPDSIKCESFIGSFRCAMCPYKDKCHGGADALKEWFKTFPAKEWPTKLNELEGDVAVELTGLFNDYLSEAGHVSKQEALEQKILEILTRNEISKIQLDNKQVYDVKFLKSPKPHFELRRGKV